MLEQERAWAQLLADVQEQLAETWVSVVPQVRKMLTGKEQVGPRPAGRLAQEHGKRMLEHARAGRGVQAGAQVDAVPEEEQAQADVGQVEPVAAQPQDAACPAAAPEPQGAAGADLRLCCQQPWAPVPHGVHWQEAAEAVRPLQATQAHGAHTQSSHVLTAAHNATHTNTRAPRIQVHMNICVQVRTRGLGIHRSALVYEVLLRHQGLLHSQLAQL